MSAPHDTVLAVGKRARESNKPACLFRVATYIVPVEDIEMTEEWEEPI